MNALFAFFRKEMLEQLRSGRLLILGIVFVLLGVMNPAVAKLTPWLLETMADSMAESGMTVTVVSVSAMDSWVQFYKNMPMALIAFVLLQSGIFTREYGSGTLVLALTKGLKRHQVLLAKSAVLVLLWTLGFWLCFGITYGYNAYFWDNSVAANLVFSVVCWWLFGVFVLSVAVLCSALGRTNTQVLLGTGGAALGSFLLGMLPRLGEYLPTFLTDGNTLIYGAAKPEAYAWAFAIAAAGSILCVGAAIPILNKKQL